MTLTSRIRSTTLAFGLQVLLLPMLLACRPDDYAAACKVFSCSAEHPVPYDAAGSALCNFALDAARSLRRLDRQPNR